MNYPSKTGTDSEEPATLLEQAEIRLRADIISGALAPLQKLRVDELKARYNVGASPVREALSRLVGEGLVSFEGNKGFRVCDLSPEDLADIAYMRTAIETHALRTAIARGDADWEAGIIASLHKLIRATESTATDRESLDAWNVAHDQFHEALVAACGSPRVFASQRQLVDQHNRYRLYLMGANIPRALIIEEHKGLAEAALARDADRASDLLGQHMLITSNFYAKLLAGETEPAHSQKTPTVRKSRSKN